MASTQERWPPPPKEVCIPPAPNLLGRLIDLLSFAAGKNIGEAQRRRGVALTHRQHVWEEVELDVVFVFVDELGEREEQDGADYVELQQSREKRRMSKVTQYRK